MDEILQSLYLKLDTTTKYLSKNAELQLLVKIIYQKNNTTFGEVYNHYSKITKSNNTNHVEELLKELVDNREVNYHKKRYSIPKSKYNKIKQAHQDSSQRLESIVSSIEPFFSDRYIVKEWLIDAVICFFNTFSEDWMSDLCYDIKAISRRRDSILDVISRRTQNNKSIDKRDKDLLPKKFIEIILRKDSDVRDVLWEFGTSAFAAKLITNSHSIDKMTIDSFKNSNCIIDTNILMHIGLESSEYYYSIKTIEDVFEALEINAGILYITQREYITAIQAKKLQILRLVENLDIKVLENTDDQFLNTAIARRCKTTEDFERFFEGLEDVPKYLNTKVSIKLFDSDPNLEEQIRKDQNNEDKKNKLNSIYKGITGRDKRENALIHDVGLISGADFLRNSGKKFFILSQEVSVNTYAKTKPFQSDLPIAIRIETLLNVLALNGELGASLDDYKSLFAEMILYNLQPDSKTFTTTDLSIMLDKNEQISKLPPDKIETIAREIHIQRLRGVSEDELTMNMTRSIQGAKMEVVEELDQTQEKLLSVERENNEVKNELKKHSSALRRRLTEDVKKEYNRKRFFFWLWRFIALIFLGVVTIVLVNLFGFSEYVKEVLFAILFIIIGIRWKPEKSKWIKQKKNYENEIEEEVQRRYEKEV